MSKIGRLPIALPQDVKIEIAGSKVRVIGPKGELECLLPKGISANVSAGGVILTKSGEKKDSSRVYGTTRSLLANSITGVSKGWTKDLEIVGIGYRAGVLPDGLTLTVGYSHPVKIPAPPGIEFKVEKTIITVSGPDKELVGQIAANIRAVREPEPYKGKGIKYKDEIIRRKAGKVAKTAGTTGPA